MYSALGHVWVNWGHNTINLSQKWYNNLPVIERFSTLQKLSININLQFLINKTRNKKPEIAMGTHVPGPLQRIKSGFNFTIKINDCKNEYTIFVVLCFLFFFFFCHFFTQKTNITDTHTNTQKKTLICYLKYMS